MLTYKLFLESTHCFNCVDCHKKIKVNTKDYYMVHDHIWEEGVQEENRGNLICLDCLEKRLGRKLKIEDFTDYPVNEPIKDELNEGLFTDYKKKFKTKYEDLLKEHLHEDIIFIVKVIQRKGIKQITKRLSEIHKVKAKNILEVYLKFPKISHIYSYMSYHDEHTMNTQKLRNLILLLKEQKTLGEEIYFTESNNGLCIKLYIDKNGK